MKFTPQQFDQLGGLRRERFNNELVQRLRTGFPALLAGKNLSDSDLGRVIERVIEMADGYGIRAEEDVRTFLDCVLTLGPAFDQSPSFPWAGDILRSDSLSGTQKVDLLHDHLVFSGP